MKNFFNFLKFQAVVCLLGFTLASCEENNPEPGGPTTGQPGNNNSNTEYHNTKYTITNGFYQHTGAVDYFFDEDADEKTHFGSTFILTDGNPTIQNDKVEEMKDGKIVIAAVLLSPGSNTFQGGTFECTDWLGDLSDMEPEAYDAKYRTKFFSPLTFVFTDTDGDKNWEEETGATVASGTFRVSGTAPNYSTEYDLTLTDGKKVKGSFAGKFTEVNE